MALLSIHNNRIEYEYHAGENNQVVVLFHPHPLYEGTMFNKVMTTSAMAAKQLGYSYVRFNYPGVSQSTGTFGFGEYEAQQASSLIDQVISEPIARLIGFSFGCNVIQHLWKLRQLDAPTIWIGASIQPDFSSAQELSTVLGMVHGKEDRLCLYADGENFAHMHQIPFYGIDQADHFFNGQQIVLREQVKELLK